MSECDGAYTVAVDGQFNPAAFQVGAHLTVGNGTSCALSSR